MQDEYSVLQLEAQVQPGEEAANRPGPGSDAGSRAHGAAREHIRRRCEEVSRPALVRGRGQAKQSDSDPFSKIVRM